MFQLMHPLFAHKKIIFYDIGAISFNKAKIIFKKQIIQVNASLNLI